MSHASAAHQAAAGGNVEHRQGKKYVADEPEDLGGVAVWAGFTTAKNATA
jgi:hypothetical protein